MQYLKYSFVVLVNISFVSCQIGTDEHADAKKPIDSLVQDSKIQRSRPSYGSGDTTEFIKHVKENKLVLEATITSENILYIAVKNNGQSQDGLAIYYCLSAKEKKVNILQVKVMDVANVSFQNNAVTGDILGSSFCN
jgi:hypothetical protein